MLLGVMSHLFRGTPADVARGIAQHRLDCVQLTPSFLGLRFQTPAEIVAERCRLHAPVKLIASKGVPQPAMQLLAFFEASHTANGSFTKVLINMMT
jgi:hypothetical protein